jgi:putative hydrolase of the HAD superfamily
MIENIKWLFFDVGSTLVDEHIAFEHRFRDIANLANIEYENVYHNAIDLYKRNRKGDLEIAKQLGVQLPRWYNEDEILYQDTARSLELLSRKFKIGIIANQELGTKERLERYGILQYIDLVIASAEEGISKPDRRIFELALKRSGCKPNEAVMIGDRIDNDIIPAKFLGMHTIWVKQGFGQYWNIQGENERPDYVVNQIEEICNYLLQERYDDYER